MKGYRDGYSPLGRDHPRKRGDERTMATCHQPPRYWNKGGGTVPPKVAMPEDEQHRGRKRGIQEVPSPSEKKSRICGLQD